MKKLENPDAFPNEFYENSHRGMTLRDYFANTAMQGILNHGIKINDESKVLEAYEAVSINAYLLADAMLKQRESKS